MFAGALRLVLDHQVAHRNSALSSERRPTVNRNHVSRLSASMRVRIACHSFRSGTGTISHSNPLRATSHFPAMRRRMSLLCGIIHLINRSHMN